MGERERMNLLGLAETSVEGFTDDASAVAEVWCRSAGWTSRPAERTLEGRVVEVLHLADEHLSRLDEYRDYWADSQDAYISLADKIIGETALLALVADRYAGQRPQVRMLVDRLARSLDPLVRSIRNEALIRRYPNSALTLACGHAALTAIGVVGPEFDRLVKSILACDPLDCSERIPFRAMERRWMTGLLYPGMEPSFDDLLPMSIATRPAHPIHMLSTDVYALTHVPMFVTDFGATPAPAAFPHALCRDSLDATAAWVLHTDNFDLMGELVLARELLGAPWTPSHLLAWKTLEHAWDKLGFLASPSFAIKEFTELPVEERASYAFRHIYHTTYVAGMLSAVMLSSASAAQPQVAGPCRLTAAESSALRQECRDAFTAAIEFCTGTPIAHDDIAHLSAVAGQSTGEPPLPAIRRLMSIWGQRDSKATGTVTHVLDKAGLTDAAVASSLADGLLTCAARSYDLAMLADLLRVVTSTGLPVTPTVAAAARFLMRQQLPSGAIGCWFLAPQSGASATTARVTTVLASALGALSTHPGLRECS
ncbi:DUF6895 family protein [Streptosporangium sp. NPDC000396]|uniref:DUF6895 family protein n=1 Tax=Streptosporangium sp. NPDC000396 TaxID=3366185 RepID=UPI0036AF77AB